MCGTDVFGQWPGQLGHGELGSNQSHVDVCLITTDGYKYCTAVSGASIGEQARTESISLSHSLSPITLYFISGLFCAPSDSFELEVCMAYDNARQFIMNL